MLKFSTSMGDFTVDLFSREAPLTVENFLSYVDDGFFDNTLFHRVIPGFVVQGGGFSPGMKQKPTKAPIQNEADNGLSNVRGTLCMARTNAIHSATSQFFVNLSDNDFLDHSDRNFGYAVFGRVAEGMEVLEKIASEATGVVGGHSDVPLEDVLLISVTRIEE
jgi:cyclophilin family peptidyl-prolyl cis-trans isomerase